MWNPPTDDGGSPITGYTIEKRDAKKATWTKAGKVSADATEFMAEGLFENTSYFFRVIAENKAGASEPLESDTAVLIKSPFGEYCC